MKTADNDTNRRKRVADRRIKILNLSASLTIERHARDSSEIKTIEKQLKLLKRAQQRDEASL